MKRRDFITQAAGSAIVGRSTADVRPAAPKQPRNILLIYCEQFQHNVASYAGGPAKTPNLEKFAARSVDFRTACTTTGLCSPARSALLTGRLGHRTGLDDNCQLWHSRLAGLNLNQTTLIEWARRKGYFVGYYGKWHLGADGPIRRGAHRFPQAGIERRADMGKTPARPDFTAMRRYYDKGRTYLEKPGYYNTDERPYEETPGAALARNGIAFLEEAGKIGLPFFLTLSFEQVHPPYHVCRPYNTMYDYRAIQLPQNLHDTFEKKPTYQADIMWPFHDTGHMTEDDWRRSNAYYRGYVTQLDRALGEVFEAVERNSLWDNTLVIVLGDHGDMNGAHNRFDKGPYCYDEIVRVPMLVRWPGISARRITRHVHSMDVNATVVEWAGLEPDRTPVDSRSLYPLMEKGDAAWNTPDEAFYRYEWYNGLWFGIRAIRTHEYKYCFNPAGPDELYDLRADPGEMKNLIDAPASMPVQRELEGRLLAHLRAVEDSLLAEKLEAHLEALQRRPQGVVR